MAETIEPACGELQSEPDNIEVIRDQVAALLAVDFRRQAELAAESGATDSGDYNVAVYVESDDPLQYVDEDTPGANPFPCVNVILDSSDPDKGTASVNKQAFTAKLYVDCYAEGNNAEDGEFSFKAAQRAWKTARLVRRILRAEANTYLRLRGIVGRVAWSFQAGEPSNTRSAIKVKMVRVTLTIDYVENVAITEGELDWDIVGIVADETGRVHFGGDKEKEENEENGDS